MTSGLLRIGTALASLLAAFLFTAPSAEATFYYDESYYNMPIPCYQYDSEGHCTVSGNRYRTRAYNGNYYRNSYYYNGSMYGNQNPYGYPVNYGSSRYYRPVHNYYRSMQNNGCYWHYGSYRCDNRY